MLLLLLGSKKEGQVGHLAGQIGRQVSQKRK